MVMMASRTFRLVSLAAAALLVAAPGGAQQAPGVLTLDDALRIARESSPTYQQVLNNPEVDEANERFARSRFFPTPTLELNTGGGPTRTTSPGTAEFRRSSNASIGVGLGMLL